VKLEFMGKVVVVTGHTLFDESLSRPDLNP